MDYIPFYSFLAAISLLFISTNCAPSLQQSPEDKSIEESQIGKLIEGFHSLENELAKLKNALEELRQIHKLSSSHGSDGVEGKANHYHYHYHDCRYAPAVASVTPVSAVDANINRPLIIADRLSSDLSSNSLSLSKEEKRIKHSSIIEQNSKSETNSNSTQQYSASLTSSEMNIEEKSPNVESDTIKATCEIRPNLHIPLLNQQNIQGRIHLWQSNNETDAPLHMRIELQGFKVECLDSNETDCSFYHRHTRSENDQSAEDKGEQEVTTMNPQNEDNENKVGNFTKFFGMHVHEGSDMTYDCQSVGRHYNPFNMTHGGPNDDVKHLGDLGNIYSDNSGRVSLKMEYRNITLTGNHGILNRTIVIHSGEDDYGRNPNNPSSKTTGNSGIRIACCVITEVTPIPIE